MNVVRKKPQGSEGVTLEAAKVRKYINLLLGMLPQ